MPGIAAHGVLAAGTIALSGDTGAFAAFIDSPDAVGRYLVEIALTPINAVFTTPSAHTHGTRAAGTTGLATDGIGDPPLSSAKKVLFSDGEYKTAPNDPVRANVWSEVRLSGKADVERIVRVSQNSASQAQVTLGEIELSDADGFMRDLLASHTAAGQISEVRHHPVVGAWGDGRIVHRGIMDAITRRSGVARISLRDIALIVAAPLRLDRYSGTGLANGGPELAGTLRPLALGKVRNVEPVLEDKGVWIYRFNNSVHEAVDEVTVKGLPLIKTGAFSGSYSDLRGFSGLAEGQWIDAPGLGVFKVNFAGGSPGGEVRCTGRGDKNFDGFVDTLGPCALRVIDYLGIDRTLIDVASFSSLPAYRMGYWFSGGTEAPSGDDILNQILGPVLGVYGSMFDERFAISRLKPPETLQPANEFAEQEIFEVAEIRLGQPPIFRQQMLYDRNWNPLTEDQLGAGLTAEQKQALTLANPPPAEAFSGEAKLQNRDAKEGFLFDSLLTEKSDATSASQGQLDFWKSSRRAFEIQIGRRGLQIAQATTWRGTHRDLPLAVSGPKSPVGIVIGRRDDYAANQVRITVIM